MLERQVAELLATYLSRFIEDVNAEQLEISLWSGHVVLNNVQLRADVLQSITALLNGECASDDDARVGESAAASSSPTHSPDAASSQNAASVRMLLAPFTVVRGIIRSLTIRVPWSSLDSEPILVEVGGVELVLGPLRARPFNAWEEQEREEAIKQQQLARYEEERLRLSREAASAFTSRSSSGQLTAVGDAAGKGKKPAAPAEAAADSTRSWFSWIWDFDRISQIAVRNVCVTLKGVCARYEFDYEGLHPTLAKAFSVFVREVRLTTTDQQFRESFVSDLFSPLCKRVVLTDIVVSTHAVRAAASPSPIKETGAFCEDLLPKLSPAKSFNDDAEGGDGASAPPTTVTTDSAAFSSSAPSSPPVGSKSPCESYAAQWSYSQAVLRVATIELQTKVVPPGCTSLHPIVDDAPPLPASSTELTVSAVEGMHADVSFGVFQALESMWRSYHQSLGCARYRKRLHLLRISRRPPPLQSEANLDATLEQGHSGVNRSMDSSLFLPAVGDTASPSRQLARRRWQFALRCVMDDIHLQRQAFHCHDRNRREVIEGIMQFCQVRRTYCQYWKRTQGIPWSPPLNALEEKKLMLMERQLSLTQVLFLRCLSYAELLQEENGLARQRAFIEEARQRKLKGSTGTGKQQQQPAEVKRGAGLWAWFSKPASRLTDSDQRQGNSMGRASQQGEASPLAAPPPSQTPAFADLVAAEWEVGQRFTAPHRAPLVQPSVPQNLLPEATEGNPIYFTLRCLIETVTVRIDPVYWPLLHDGSVPAPPMNTPLRHVPQQFCVRLSAVEVFFTTVPDDRPDKASWSFFVGSARLSFEGVLRSVLLQSKEADGEDFIVVKQNACRTHVGVWVAPQLIICQPLHEWRWWGMEVAAFVKWFKALQRTFYTPTSPLPPSLSRAAVASAALEETPIGSHSASRSNRVIATAVPGCATPKPRRTVQSSSRNSSLFSLRSPSVAGAAGSAAPSLVWNITIQATDVCVPLFARDLDDSDLDVIDRQPSGLSSLVMVDSATTAVPLKNASLDAATRLSSLEDDGNAQAAVASDEQQLSGAAAAAAAAANARSGARRKSALHAFLYKEGIGEDNCSYERGEGNAAAREEEGEGVLNTDSYPVSAVGSFASTKPERCFLNNDACLVLSISATCLCTVPPGRKRYQGAGNEYCLCIGDPDRAVRLFCQKGLSPATLGMSRHLELMSFAAGEVLLNPDELSIVFSKGIDFVVEPDAFAALNDGLLKPAVFSAKDSDAQLVRSVTEEVQLLCTAAGDGGNGALCGKDLSLPPSWRLSSAGCMEIAVDAREGEAADSSSVVMVARCFPKDCARHILTAVLPSSVPMTETPQMEVTEPRSAPERGAHEGTLEYDVADTPHGGVFGGRTIVLGVSVARLLVRSVDNEDVAEVVLVAAEEVPLATEPYRGALVALGPQEPRAMELVWNPPLKEVPPPRWEGALSNCETPLPPPQAERRQRPFFLLSIPDLTMTTAAGQKLLTVEQLTAVQAASAAQDAPSGVAVTIETVSVYFDTALVDLMEVAVGTLCALRPMETPLPSLPQQPQLTVTRKCSDDDGTKKQTTLEETSVATRNLRVQSIYLQAPLTKSDVEGAPYVEVNGHLTGLEASFGPTLCGEEGEVPGSCSGHRVRAAFELSDAVQLVDYTGGDPEIKSLVTALPRGAGENANTGSDATQPLRCGVNVVIPRLLGAGSSGSKNHSANGLAVPLPATMCQIDVQGGAIHLYFPFLYLFLDVLTKDERIQRLKRLPSSSLLHRGFTDLSCEMWRGKWDATPFSAFSTPTTTYARASAIANNDSPSSPPSSPSRVVEVTATLSNVDVFLATDAAVPIDVRNPDTMCVVHVTEVKAGVTRTATNTADSTSEMQLRTRAYLDTVSWYLVDLESRHRKRVCLPSLKVRAEKGVHLVPKESLMGYMYQRGNEKAMAVLVGFHPPPPPTDTARKVGDTAEREARKEKETTAATGELRETGAAAGLSIDLDTCQCRTLIRFFARNVAQAPVAAAQEGRAPEIFEEAAHSMRSRRKYGMRARRLAGIGSVDEMSEHKAPRLLSPTAASGTTAAVTVLVTIPPVSVVMRAESATPPERLGDAVADTRGITYELALRRGAQFYSASGGQWSNSPVKNGQISGLELNASEDAKPNSLGVEPPRVQHLFTSDLLGVALVVARSSPTSSAAHTQALQESRREVAPEEASGANDGVEHHYQLNDGRESAITPSLRVAAAVRNTTVRVPHVRWWLRLYALFVDSAAAPKGVESTQHGSALLSHSTGPMSLQDSFAAAEDGGGVRYTSGSVQRHRDNVSSCQSSALRGPRDERHGGYRGGVELGPWASGSHRRSPITSQAPRWIYGSVEITQTQVSLGDDDDGGSSHHGIAHHQQRLPWCRLFVPEVRLMVAPVSLPSRTGVSRVYDEFTLNVPRCPELLLRSSNTTRHVDGDADSNVVYVSVLKVQRVATPSAVGAGAVPAPSALAGSCIRVQLIRSPQSHLIANLHYGRSYHMTDLTLHRTCAIQVQANGLLLNLPASELFGFAQELLRQSAEVRALLAPSDINTQFSPFRSDSPARTYTGLEAQLTNVGIIITSESPHAVSAAAAAAASGLPIPPQMTDDSPWCGVTVASISLTTDVELENVLTRAGEPATLMDDALAVGWRMRVWHLVSHVSLRGIVVACHHGVTAKWSSPSLNVSVSQPLLRTVVCVRANRYTGLGDEASQLDSESPSLGLHQRSSTDFFHVEPTAPYVCSELNTHLLARAVVEVGRETEATGEDSVKKEASNAPVSGALPAIEVPVATAYTLSRSLLHLTELWKVAQQQHQHHHRRQEVEAPPQANVDVEATPSRSSAASSLLQLDEPPAPVMWYEVKLSLCQRCVRVVSDIPRSVALNAERHCVVAITVDEMITLQLDRDMVDSSGGSHGTAVRAADGGDLNTDSNEDNSGAGSSDAAEAAAPVVREQYRVCIGAVRVCDGAGNLICLLSKQGQDAERAPCAMTLEYFAAESEFRVVADHLLLAASSVTTTFAVKWLRACQTWRRLWATSATAAVAEPSDRARNQEKRVPEANTDFVLSTSLQLSVTLRQAEVLLAPCGYLIVEGPRLCSTATQTKKGPSDGVVAAEAVHEVCCDSLELYSTAPVGEHVPHTLAKARLLAAVESPLLRSSYAVFPEAAAAMVCRVPSISFYNHDYHSWRLCTVRAAACLRSATTLWLSTRGGDVEAEAVRDGQDKHNGGSSAVTAVGAASLPASWTTHLTVDRVEVFCFSPQDEHANTASPALHLRADSLEMAMPGRDAQSEEEAPVTTAAKPRNETRCRAHVKLFASCLPVASHSASQSPSLLVLLEETEVTVVVCAGSLPDAADELDNCGSSEVQIWVAEKGVRLHVPTHGTLQSVAGALCMAVGQHVPSRSRKTPVAVWRHSEVTEKCIASNSDCDDVTGAGRRRSDAGQQRWGVSIYVPRVVCDFTTTAAGAAAGQVQQRIAAVNTGAVCGRLALRADRQRPFLELRVAELNGETDFIEQEPCGDSITVTVTPTRFFSMKPFADTAQTTSMPVTTLPERKAAPLSEVQQVAFFLRQKSLPLSHKGSGETRSSASDNSEDVATALTVRLHSLQTHVTLAFLQALASGVLQPMVTGVRRACATGDEGAVVGAFHSLVLQVTGPRTPLPPLGELERHAALVRVVEVKSDWTLTHDLVLGSGCGSADFCNLQLHFCNSAPHNVITVRGDPTAAEKGRLVTVRLSFCASVTGDVCPAIRVDSDLTVKFEQVRVVVMDGAGEEAVASPGAFVVLGDRALCVFPAPPSTVLPGEGPISHADSAVASTREEGRVSLDSEAAAAVVPTAAGSPWPTTAVYSIDVKVGFDAVLAAQRRCFAVAGTWQMRYRFETKWKGSENLRSEREGESTLTLLKCTNETADLTHTPVAVVARLGYADQQNSRLKLTFTLGSTLWRLPLGHAQLLLAVVNCVANVFVQTPLMRSKHAVTSATTELMQWRSAASASTNGSWVPPGVSSVREGKTRSGTAAAMSAAAPLDVEGEIPWCSLFLTNDLQQPLAAFNVEKLWFKCTSDMQLSDAVINAAASLSVTDRLLCPAALAVDDGVKTVNGGSASAEVLQPQQKQASPLSAANCSRVLLSARPTVTLVWTRFSADSHSLSLSMSIDDVVATLPIMTALQALRRASADIDAGTHAFWNDTGVDLVVYAAPDSRFPHPPHVTESSSGDDRSSPLQWRVPASPARNAVVTGMSSTVSKVVFATQSISTGGDAGAALPTELLAAVAPFTPPTPPLSATVDLRQLRQDVVHRLRLPGYMSPFGALDLVVRRCVRDSRSVLHLATTVELSNAFYSTNDADGSMAVVLRSSGVNTAAFVVKPRSIQFVPLPILQDRLALEMDGCVYGPPARLLTWAMVADAMTVMADQLVACAATGADSNVAGGGAGTAAAARSVAATLRKLGLETEGVDSDRGDKRPALTGRQVKILNSSTISFPVLLRPLPPSVAGSIETVTSLTDGGSKGAGSTPSALPPPSAGKGVFAVDRLAPSASRVVQLTWKRHCSRQDQRLLFSGQLPPCEYTVNVEPVWTLWNHTGCRLRLRMRLPRSGTKNTTTDGQRDAVSTQPPLPSQSEPQQHASQQEEVHDGRSSAPANVAEDVIGSAVVENGTCFQWLPTSLSHLDENIAVYFQIEAPSASMTTPRTPSQWWSAAASLSLKESPPPYIRLQQSSNHTRGALCVERHGSATVVLRCAAVLRSNLSQPVFLRDAACSLPVLGTDAQGCLRPQQVLPLFFSEYVTTLAPNAKRVGFTVRDKPLCGTSTDEREETDPYYLTTPVTAMVLSADEREGCTDFYSVSAVSEAEVEATVASTAAPRVLNDTLLWRPAPPPTLQLRALCSIHNTDPHRTLFLRPFVREGSTPVATMTALSTTETRIAPGETREVLRFSAHADEPEVHFCYGEEGAIGTQAAHAWSPPVKLLTLATSTLPLVLKHSCTPASSLFAAPEEDSSLADAFLLFPVPRAVHETPFATTERFRCLALQSSTEDGRLCVSVGLQAVPPLRIVNRLNTTLQFTQTLSRTTAGGEPSPSAATTSVTADGVATALCSRASPARSYLVAAESNSLGCWDVPTLGFQGVRITLHSNRLKGVTASVDVDLLKCAAAPSSGLQIGQTNAYVYVSLDHRTHQYTVTVVHTRQLGSRLLFQPRRLTQLEVFMPQCTVYLAAVTLPTTGPFSRVSVLARGARGRLRTGLRCGGDTRAVVVPPTATDEDVLTLLRQLEVDVLCVRVVGVYGSLTMTERHVLGSGSVGIVEAVDCTTPEATYPVVFRMSSTPQDIKERGPSSEEALIVAGSDTNAVPPLSSSSASAYAATATTGGVPHFADPSWCNVEVQLTWSDVRAGGSVMVPIHLLRVSVPPITVHLHDELLFTLRTSLESVREEMAAVALVAEKQFTSACLSRTTSIRGGSSLHAPEETHANATTRATPCTGLTATSRRRSRRTILNAFLYELHVSAVTAEVTYTRSADRRYNPFQNLGVLPAHLIPSVEGLSIKLKEVSLANVELVSATSLAKVMQSFVWPLYRTQLLLQCWKVVGSLDMLGNPQALLGSWSRGVWDLITNASGKSRWAGTRDFLRTTTSSTLHSVGVLARSIGNLTGGGGTSSTASAHTAIASAGVRNDARGGLLSVAGGQRRGVFSEVFAEVRGGVVDAVTKPLRGARDGGVNGFFLGVASGVVGLVGRPVFGFFRGVGVTSEFYARLLAGQTTLTVHEARLLALKRNYRLSSPPDAAAAPAAAANAGTASSAGARWKAVPLATSTFEQLMSDIPRWRRGEEANVRVAVTRVGVHSAALFLPYAAVSAFFTPEEYAESLPTSLTALLVVKLLYALGHPDAQRTSSTDGETSRQSNGSSRKDEELFGDGTTSGRENMLLSRTHVARECDRASHIKASLGVSALHKYVSGDVFVRVCSLSEIEASVTAASLRANYVVLLAKAVNAAGEELFLP
jgi:hypothetical protein